MFLRRIPDYQSGFLPNRSCDDLIFVLTRVMEERWNHNLPTFLMELDYRKAFDLVNIHQLPNVLSTQGVPHYLINRIVKACMRTIVFPGWESKRPLSTNLLGSSRVALCLRCCSTYCSTVPCKNFASPYCRLTLSYLLERPMYRFHCLCS